MTTSHAWGTDSTVPYGARICTVCGINETVFLITKVDCNTLAAMKIASDIDWSGYEKQHPVKEPSCECGAAKIGCGKGKAGHSSWCPWKG